MNADGSVPDVLGVPLLRAADYPSGQLAAAAARGELIRLTRGSFVAVPQGGKYWQRKLAVEVAKIRAVSAAVPEDCAIGGWHAAYLHGIPVLRFPEKVSVISAKKGSGKPVLGYRRHYRKLPEDDFAYVRGIRVTSYRRTVLDVIRMDDPVAALVAFDHVLRVGTGANRFEVEVVEQRLGQVRAEFMRLVEAESGRGVVRARAIVAAGNPLAESVAETLGRRAALIMGLPDPVLQVRIELPGGGQVYGDLGWKAEVDGEEAWLLMEVDGAGKYEGDDVARRFHAEKVRERELVALGHKVLRFTYSELREPDLRTFRNAVFAVFPEEILAALKPRVELMTEAEKRAR